MKDLLCQIGLNPHQLNIEVQFWKCAQMKNGHMKSAQTKD